MTVSLVSRLQAARKRLAFYARNGHTAQAAAARGQIASLQRLIAQRRTGAAA